jgi:methylase of polypeptide subunit release factors
VAPTHRPLPPQPGSAADRRAIAGCLARASFSEGVVCARLGLQDFAGLGIEGVAAVAARFDGRDPAALLIRLFVLGGQISSDDLGRAMDDAERAAFVAAGLVAPIGTPTPDAGTPDQWYCPIHLVPLAHRFGDVLVTCDRRVWTDGSPLELFPDIVFSAHNPLTLQFLRLLPTTNTGTVLDLCSGTGIAAMIAASTALRVTAIDVTERCTAFARFNCWVNDLEHVDVRCGNLYEPVRDEHFDRIVAHPPYVPTLADAAVYRDGGETGDRLLRLILQSLPDHLTPGGTFHVLTMGLDTEAAPFEMRAREWLGDAAPEFDVVFGIKESKSAEAFARSLAAKATVASEEADFERWMHVFGELHAREFVYGALVGRRNGAPGREPQTRRVAVQGSLGPEGFERLFHWFDWLRLPDRRDRVLNARPALSPDMKVEVTHVVRDGHFAADRFRLQNGDAAFKVQLQTDGWVVAMMDAFDGTKTVAEVFGVGRMARSIPEQMDDSDFVELVCLLLEKGFLRWSEAATP